MNKKKVVGIQKYEKNGKQNYILHTVTVESIESEKFSGQRVDSIFLFENQMRSDIVVGSVIRVYYDNYKGRASLSGIELCK